MSMAMLGGGAAVIVLHCALVAAALWQCCSKKRRVRRRNKKKTRASEDCLTQRKTDSVFQCDITPPPKRDAVPMARKQSAPAAGTAAAAHNDARQQHGGDREKEEQTDKGNEQYQNLDKLSEPLEGAERTAAAAGAAVGATPAAHCDHADGNQLAGTQTGSKATRSLSERKDKEAKLGVKSHSSSAGVALAPAPMATAADEDEEAAAAPSDRQRVAHGGTAPAATAASPGHRRTAHTAAPAAVHEPKRAGSCGASKHGRLRDGTAAAAPRRRSNETQEATKASCASAPAPPVHTATSKQHKAASAERHDYENLEEVCKEAGLPPAARERSRHAAKAQRAAPAAAAPAMPHAAAARGPRQSARAAVQQRQRQRRWRSMLAASKHYTGATKPTVRK